MIRKLVRYGVLASAIGIGACENALVVQNPNQGNTDKVLATAADAEALIGSYYKRWFSGVFGSTSDWEGRANVWSLMNFSSLANNCQNTSYPFTSAGVENKPGNTCGGETFRLYAIEGEVNRVASSMLGKIDGGLNLGTNARNLRARAFAEFLRGMSLGYIALVYDSAAVVSAATAGDDAGALVAHTVVMDSAYAAFARAITAAQDPLATAADGSGFPIPTTWMPSPTSYTATQFVRLIRSYRARFRAYVARTPAERAAADWTSIIADAQNGITADEMVNTGTAVGGVTTPSWYSQYQTFVTWHQIPPFYIGMGDQGTSYATWIATPVGDRGTGNASFFMDSPDLRFPQGATRAAQNADFALSSCEINGGGPCKRYFVNRPSGSDQFGGVGWGWSNYDFARIRSWRIKGDAGTAVVGKVTMFTRAELRLLEAEGQYRAGAFAAAAALVDVSRTAVMVGGVATGGGLPGLVANGVTNAVTTVSGGAACVPKVPQGPAFTTVACGNLWEALKYERRIETAHLGYAPWWLDGRGMGDLPEGTPLFLPVPYQDWQARNKPTSLLYGTGQGVGTAPGSVTTSKGNYGW